MANMSISNNDSAIHGEDFSSRPIVDNYVDIVDNKRKVMHDFAAVKGLLIGVLFSLPIWLMIYYFYGIR